MGTVTVALVFGGRSSEHSISCATAAGILAAIDRDRYDVVPVGVTADGVFVLEQDDPEAFRMSAAGEPPRVTDNGSRVAWPTRAGERVLTVSRPDAPAARVAVDVVFPLLHGRWGEDGTIQGMLDLVDMPYVGSGVLGSALGMDKHFTKTVLRAAGIAVAPWSVVSRARWRAAPHEVHAEALEWGLPAFVKPARGGSSVGVGRVAAADELDSALAAAFAEDDRVLVERQVTGREIEVGVLGGRRGAPARTGAPGEIVVEKGFYDFDAKYRDSGGVRLACPADLEPAVARQAADLAARAFDVLGLAGLARVDFFLTADGFVVNEVNTMPGFTPISMFPTSWRAVGLDYPSLIDELISLALE
ncbi:MAG TPA: D-alanine--D-alanine ligase family protein [Microbacteriaceae bacterium]|nr:D-alanine--D-alanine ligase family protein [Microbacteriaceae bacterium]